MKFSPPFNSITSWQAAFEWGCVYCSRRIFIVRKMTKRLEQRTWFRLFFLQKSRLLTLLIQEIAQDSSPVIMVFMKSGSLFVESSMSWVYGQDLETKFFRHFPHIENPTRAINTTLFKCCLPSTDAIDQREEIHTCIWRFKVASRKCASLKSTMFSQKEKLWYFSNRVVHIEKLLTLFQPHRDGTAVTEGIRATGWQWGGNRDGFVFIGGGVFLYFCFTRGMKSQLA